MTKNRPITERPWNVQPDVGGYKIIHEATEYVIARNLSKNDAHFIVRCTNIKTLEFPPIEKLPEGYWDDPL